MSVSEPSSSGSAPAETTLDALNYALGWPGNVDMSLETAGITAKRYSIPLHSFLRTDPGHIFAASDVNGYSILVH